MSAGEGPGIPLVVRWADGAAGRLLSGPVRTVRGERACSPIAESPLAFLSYVRPSIQSQLRFYPDAAAQSTGNTATPRLRFPRTSGGTRFENSYPASIVTAPTNLGRLTA
jgi:hypothetical protein